MMSAQRQDETMAAANQELVIEVEDESKNPHVGEHATTASWRHEPEGPEPEPEPVFRRFRRLPVTPFSVTAPLFPFPRDKPVVVDVAAAGATIERVPRNLRDIASQNRRSSIIAPTAVAIGPYHRGSSKLFKMDAAKHAAMVEFCRAACKTREQVYGEILSVSGDAHRCYDYDDDSNDGCYDYDDDDDDDSRPPKKGVGEFVDMMLLDGCFLLQFMFSMVRRDASSSESDPLMSRPEVHRRIDAIARDVLLLENQIPWLVLQVLMAMRPSFEPVVDRFLALMASAFDIGNANANSPPPTPTPTAHDHEPPPPHLLGLFHRRQMGAARTRSLRVPTLSSLSSTALELAEMGVRLVAGGKTEKFGDMAMTKRRHGLFGELSLAPVVLTEVTQCWLFNMAAYEACLGFTRADNFAVSSYVTLASILMNRREDVQEMRAKGLVVSAFSDEGTLHFFKWLAPHLQVGHRYYDVFRHLQEYRQERWLWIAVHRFLYNNFKTIVAVLSAAGVLAGLFKTILSLKEPNNGLMELR